jgi:hypothetical protein
MKFIVILFLVDSSNLLAKIDFMWVEFNYRLLTLLASSVANPGSVAFLTHESGFGIRNTIFPDPGSDPTHELTY